MPSNSTKRNRLPDSSSRSPAIIFSQVIISLEPLLFFLIHIFPKGKKIINFKMSFNHYAILL